MIISVPKNTLTADQKRALTKKGHIVIECDDPEKVKVINTEVSIDTNEFFMSALYAMKRNNPTSASEYFVNELYSRLNIKEEPAK